MKDKELRRCLLNAGTIYEIDTGISKIIAAPRLNKKLNALMDYMGLEFEYQPERLIVKSKNKGFVEEKK